MGAAVPETAPDRRNPRAMVATKRKTRRLMGTEKTSDALAGCPDRDWSEMSSEARKASLRAEISRLQAELYAIEEDEKINTPHKQLSLFDQ